jgi:hypothetical protein
MILCEHAKGKNLKEGVAGLTLPRTLFGIANYVVDCLHIDTGPNNLTVTMKLVRE